MTESYAYGLWPVVIINAAIFIFFSLGFLRPKVRREWRSLGAFTAFVVALFTEMYGFPLTIYLLTSVLGSRYPIIDPFSHMNGHLWLALGVPVPVFELIHLVSNMAIWGGLIIMGVGWWQIHKAGGTLVTSGLYRLVRHPQYLGLFLITVGFLLQWPTIITVAMWPVLMFMYYRLARREEKEMESRFGNGYLAYRQRVGMFWPRLVSASHTVEA